jgi:lipopolysaccharide heptosyltransferase I
MTCVPWNVSFPPRPRNTLKSMGRCFTRPTCQSSLDQIEPARICLIKPSALGDVVQTLPILSALRSRFPCAHIAWLVNQAYADLLRGHPHLNEIIPFDRGGAGAGTMAAWKSMKNLADALRARRFDLVCDLQGLLRSGLMSWATRAARRVGLGDCREGSRFLYTDIVRVPAEALSAVDRYWLMADALGAGAVPKQFLLGLDAAEHEWAERHLCGRRGLHVAIHAGARWATKRWPPESFAEIARRLHRDSGANIVLVGGPETADAAHYIESAVRGHCENLVGRTTLRQLAALLARVHLLFTNDSGPMHLAAALRTPVAAIFTCTSPERAQPYGPGHTLFASNVWCAASHLKRCSRLECMTELTPDRVWPALSQQMATLAAQVAA